MGIEEPLYASEQRLHDDPATACPLDVNEPVEERVEVEQEAGGVGRLHTRDRVRLVEAIRSEAMLI